MDTWQKLVSHQVNRQIRLEKATVEMRVVGISEIDIQRCIEIGRASSIERRVLELDGVADFLEECLRQYCTDPKPFLDSIRDYENAAANIAKMPREIETEYMVGPSNQISSLFQDIWDVAERADNEPEKPKQKNALGFLEGLHGRTGKNRNGGRNRYRNV